MFLTALLTGFALGVFACAVLWALIALHKPKATVPTLHRRRPTTQPCIACYGGDLPCVCRTAPTRRQYRDLPIPESAQQSDVGGIDYKFLGTTGEEQ